MNRFELSIRGKLKRFSGPSSWAELSDHQAVSLIRLRRSVQQKPETLFVALRLLYGFKPKQQQWLFDKHFLGRQHLSDEQILRTLEMGQSLLETLSWIGQDDPDACFPTRFRIYDFHYLTPRIYLGRLLNKTVFVGPQSGLGNCTFEEFMFADKAFRDGNLPLLAAILCRPAQEGTADRMPLDPASVNERTHLFARLEPALLERIAFGYGSTLLNLQKIFPQVFPTLTEDEQKARKKNKAGSWLDVAIGMAKLDVTKVHEVEQVNLYLALKVLNEQLKQAEEMERQLEDMKTKR